MSRHEKLNRRRRAFYDAICRGSTLAEAVESFAEKYHVTQSCLRKDWEVRATWGCISPIDTSSALTDAVSKVETLRSMLWKKATNSETDRDQIRALTALVNIEFKTIEVLQSLGFVSNVMPQHKISPEAIEVMHTFIVEIAGEDDVEAQKGLVRKLMKAQHDGRYPESL
jgi:hypothetical protein